jgi:energy-converting hydrogenase Eha subunit E
VFVCVDWRIILKLSTAAGCDGVYRILDLEFRFVVVNCIFIRFPVTVSILYFIANDV